MVLEQFLQDNYNREEYIASMYINNPQYGTSTYQLKVDNAIKQLNPNQVNQYMTLNPLSKRKGRIKRDKEHISRLKWLYVDLDTYNTGMEKDKILLQLEDEYYNKRIPTPTYVIDSGRGLYLLWRIDEHINAVPRWELVQRYLYETLKEFGADGSVVTDTARVLRTIGSINSKSKTIVKALDYYNYTYTLYSIIKNYIPNRVYACKDVPNIKPMATKGKIICINTENTLLVARLHDLEQLLTKYRDMQNGKRENILFLYRYWQLCVTNNKELALELTIHLNNRLKNPLPQKEVVKATKSAEKYYNEDKCLKLKNSTLIDFLSLTAEEMESMKTIISSNIKKERKRSRDRQSYLKRIKSQGKDTKEEQIIKRRKKIAMLLMQGYNQTEICDLLHISKSTYYDDKKCIVLTYDANKTVQNTAKKEGKLVTVSCPEKSALVLKDVVLMLGEEGVQLSFPDLLPVFRPPSSA